MKNQELRVSRALSFRIHPDGKIYGLLSKSNGEFVVAPEVFAILTYFATPRNLKQLSQTLPQFLKKHFTKLIENLPDSLQCKEVIEDLISAGFLLEDKTQATRTLQNDGFGDPWIQWAMISDVPRSMSYEKALAQTITKESVVLDLGSGTGFLSACALSDGAKKVYAVEESNIAESIIPNLTSLNLIAKGKESKNFVLHNNNSYDVDFSDDINLVVSELFGNDPFQEGLYATLQNVTQRIKNQNLEFIPKKLEVYGEFIDILDHPTKPRIQLYQLNEHTQTDPKTKNAPHSAFYSKFLTTLKNVLPFEGISFPIHLTQKNFERLSQPVLFGECSLNPMELDELKFAKKFKGIKKIKIEEMAQVKTQIDTPVFIFWFRAYLTDDISISSHPKETDYAFHWSPVAVVLNKKIETQRNAQINTNRNLNAQLTIKYNLAPGNIALECQIFDNDVLIGTKV